MISRIMVLFVAVTFGLHAFATTDGEPNQMRWVINDVGVPIIAEANTTSKFIVAVKCSGVGVVSLYDLSSYNQSSVGKAMSVKVRVDKNEVIEAIGELIADNDQVALMLPVNDSLINQMILGSDLRVAFKISGRDNYGLVERYRLNGFSSAYNRSKDFCANEVQQYFPDDGDFF